MIAKLQRVLLVLWIAALAGTLVAWPLEWIPGYAAVTLVAALLVGHGFVLAGEFMAMHWTNQRDTAPRAGLRDVVAAWWQESLHAPKVFFWRQPLRHGMWKDHLPAGAPSARGVVLVHGYFCNRGLWNPWLSRLTHARIPFIAVDLAPAFGSIDAYAPVIDAAIVRMRKVTGHPPIVVAHSMGGLAVRRWWIDRAPDDLHHLITLGSPHHGTRLATLGTTQNAQQMRVGSDWLHELQAAEQPATRARVTCVYSHCDNIVFPASTATLSGTRTVHLPGTPHVAMVDHPVAWNLLQEQLRMAPAHPGASDPAPCSRTAP
ncbi:esterase/lipase family protein [Rubrivivax albus]|uniref:Alpha/beta fold hydrolase n=1 Tax=Rubrivivax albus TaxID=2499835 RepID=A0A3S2U9K1_9BURK|nr:alpha/beta fold hydrolase [Rubrivivax albus]RVT52337.1 alpha/beta fold hydrolase [Rubrivivax albus]